MGLFISKLMLNQYVKRDHSVVRHPDSNSVGSGICHLTDSKVDANIIERIKFYLSYSYNDSASFFSTCKGLSRLHTPDFAKINKVINASRFGLPHDYSFTQDESQLLLTLKELCHEIIIYCRTWLNEYIEFKNSSFQNWQHSDLNKNKIRTLINQLPKVLVTNNRIGVSIAKLDYIATYRDIKIKKLTRDTRLVAHAIEIVTAQKNIPDSVMNDYFRGSHMNGELLDHEDIATKNKNIAWFCNNLFIVVLEDGSYRPDPGPTRLNGGDQTHIALARNSISHCEFCIATLNLVLNDNRYAHPTI